jgi:GNAT superfamily N-acetyltransferase
VNLGLLEPSDLDAAAGLSAAEGWNQTATDWTRLIRLEPSGCFAARVGADLVGAVTAVSYGRALGWIGMMVVRPDSRRQGIGARLMRLALEYLEGLGITRVGLDATPAGRPLYESLGFTAEAEFERWQGIAVRGNGPATNPVPNESRQMMARLDFDAYGVDRSPLLESLVADGVGDPLVLESMGYALARRGRTAAYIGPVIATTPAVAGNLLAGMLARLAGEDVCLDLRTGGPLAPSFLIERGLSKRRTLTRMYLGSRLDAGRPELICASAGPELG